MAESIIRINIHNPNTPEKTEKLVCHSFIRSGIRQLEQVVKKQVAEDYKRQNHECSNSI